MLIKSDLLNEYLGNSDSERIDLSNLKISLAHFGGERQWEKYLQDGFSNNGKHFLISRANEDDTKTLNGNNNIQIWNNTSWLPIICDLM